MLKKRLIGVVTIKNSWAVQSVGYRSYLPLGHPEYVVENLDRWGVDEIIVICIDRSHRNLGPDLSILKRLSSLRLSTPLTFGGGIHTAKQAVSVIQLGAERICIDAVLHDDPEKIFEMERLIGSQALVACLPFSIKSKVFFWYNYRTQKSILFPQKIYDLFNKGLISEALIIDWRNEGSDNGFDINLIKKFPFKNISLIAFGGLNRINKLTAVLKCSSVVGAGVGNFLSYTEHAVQTLKTGLHQCQVRPSVYLGTV